MRPAVRSGLLVARLLACRRGMTAIEYALIIAGVALALVTTVFALGEDLNGFFNSLAGELNSR